MEIASFDSSDLLSSQFFVNVLLLNEDILELNLWVLCITYTEVAFKSATSKDGCVDLRLFGFLFSL